MSKPTDLLRPSQVTEMLDISEATLWRWTNNGVLPVIKVGTSYRRYRREDVDALLRPSVAVPEA